MDGEELDAIWVQGYSQGYSRAVDFVKREIEEGDPHKNIDSFLAWLVEGMIDDWSSNVDG